LFSWGAVLAECSDGIGRRPSRARPLPWRWPTPQTAGPTAPLEPTQSNCCFLWFISVVCPSSRCRPPCRPFALRRSRCTDVRQGTPAPDPRRALPQRPGDRHRSGRALRGDHRDHPPRPRPARRPRPAGARPRRRGPPPHGGGRTGPHLTPGDEHRGQAPHRPDRRRAAPARSALRRAGGRRHHHRRAPAPPVRAARPGDHQRPGDRPGRPGPHRSRRPRAPRPGTPHHRGGRRLRHRGGAEEPAPRGRLPGLQRAGRPGLHDARSGRGRREDGDGPLRRPDGDARRLDVDRGPPPGHLRTDRRRRRARHRRRAPGPARSSARRRRDRGADRMIVTLTANPSLDRTVDLGGPLTPGGVHRITADSIQPGGKGINVALGVQRAGLPVLAVLPAAPGDPLLSLLDEAGLPHRCCEVAARVRTNLTVLSAPDTTTKPNEPEARLSPAEVTALEELLLTAVSAGDSVMLSGSLAPGLPGDEYVRLVAALHGLGVRVGVDTSDAPLAALAAALPRTAPDFLKPNPEEL